MPGNKCKNFLSIIFKLYCGIVTTIKVYRVLVVAMRRKVTFFLVALLVMSGVSLGVTAINLGMPASAPTVPLSESPDNDKVLWTEFHYGRLVLAPYEVVTWGNYSIRYSITSVNVNLQTYSILFNVTDLRTNTSSSFEVNDTGDWIDVFQNGMFWIWVDDVFIGLNGNVQVYLFVGDQVLRNPRAYERVTFYTTIPDGDLYMWEFSDGYKVNTTYNSLSRWFYSEGTYNVTVTVIRRNETLIARGGPIVVSGVNMPPMVNLTVYEVGDPSSVVDYGLLWFSVGKTMDFNGIQLTLVDVDFDRDSVIIRATKPDNTTVETIVHKDSAIDVFNDDSFVVSLENVFAGLDGHLISALYVYSPQSSIPHNATFQVGHRYLLTVNADDEDGEVIATILDIYNPYMESYDDAFIWMPAYNSSTDIIAWAIDDCFMYQYEYDTFLVSGIPSELGSLDVQYKKPSVVSYPITIGEQVEHDNYTIRLVDVDVLEGNRKALISVTTPVGAQTIYITNLNAVVTVGDFPDELTLVLYNTTFNATTGEFRAILGILNSTESIEPPLPAGVPVLLEAVSSGGIGKVQYEWDFNGNGITDTTGKQVVKLFEHPGEYSLTLTAKTESGQELNITKTVEVVSTAPLLKNHSPIYIDGDDDFTPENGVVGGSGTADDPYVIEGWFINATTDGISIQNTRKYFVIRNCLVSSTDDFGSGIWLSNVTNGQIYNNTIKGDTGIVLTYTTNVTIYNNTISGNNDGVSLWYSTNVTIYLNSIAGGASVSNSNVTWHSLTPLIYEYNDRMFTNYLGNYWSDYNGTDTNGDGIGDSPYVINDNNIDEYPLMAPPSNYSTVTPRSKGDVNGDGEINAVDALLYLKYAVGLDISPYHLDPQFDDLTGDGKITVADALKVLRIAVGLEPI